MDKLGAFVDVNDFNLESDTREEMRVLLDAIDDSNEIPDLIEKLIFDEDTAECKRDSEVGRILECESVGGFEKSAK